MENPEQVIARVKETIRGIEARLKTQSILVHAQFGPNVGAYYDACLESYKMNYTFSFLSEKLVAPLMVSPFVLVLESYSTAMLVYTRKACGASPSLLQEIVERAKADCDSAVREVQELTGYVVESIKK